MENDSYDYDSQNTDFSGIDEDDFRAMIQESLPSGTVKIPDFKKLKRVYENIAKIKDAIDKSVEDDLLDGEPNPVEYQLDSAKLIGTGLVFSAIIPDFGSTFSFEDAKNLINNMSLCNCITIQPRTDNRAKISFSFPDVFTVLC